MFRSRSSHTIDAKGRVIIPSRFRETLKQEGGYGVMVTYHDQRLYAYSLKGWKDVETQILRVKTEAMAKFRLSFVGSVAECLCDRQDRILIPKDLREDAGLSKDIVLVGNIDRFEIWDRERWDDTNKRMKEELKREEVREEIASLGL